MSLPSGYKRLEYIQSSGTQYIDTGFKPNQDTRVVTKISFNVLTSGTSSYAFGAANSGSSGMFELSTGNNLIRLGYGGTAVTQTFPSTKPFTIDFNKNVVTINGTAYTLTAATFTGTYSMYICDTNRGTAYRAIPAVTVYSFQIYDNGTLVRDFIPCKNASGVVGMWDDVNSTFYGNAGSGTFTAGPEIKGAHKVLIDGTLYDAKSGRPLIDGTGYSLKKGRTLIAGTGYDVSFLKKVFHITYSIGEGYYNVNRIIYNGEHLKGNGELYLEEGESIDLYIERASGYQGGVNLWVNLNGTRVASYSTESSITYRFTPTSNCNIIGSNGNYVNTAVWDITTQ